MKKLLSPTLLLALATVITGCFGSSSSVDVSSSSSSLVSSSISSESSTVSSVSSSSSELPPAIDTRYTDALKLTTSFSGKEFIDDGIGEVTFTRCTDGDTANFNSNGFVFPVRFLGIDTPESTSKIEPWGLSAARFTCDTLSHANSIVLEAEGVRIDSTGSRYLGWVWYQEDAGDDYRLINLEIIEQAYSASKGLKDSAYEQTFYDADLKTQLTLKRIWGEDDPEYDYSDAPQAVTIADLRANYDTYAVHWVFISQALVTRKMGAAFYIQDDSGAGIYLYPGYSMPSTSFIKVGDIISIQGKLTQYSEELQLIELQIMDTVTFELLYVLHSRNNAVVALDIVVSQMEAYRGVFVRLNNLTISSIGDANANGAYTVYARDSSNQEVKVRIDSSVKNLIPSSTFTIGETYAISGISSRYFDDNQLMVALASDVQLVG